MRQTDAQASFATLLSTLGTTVSGAPGQALAPAAAGRDLYHSARLGLRHGLNTLRLWRERAHGRQQLRTFDDHLLRDIGITRLQAEAEAQKPFWRA
jgi:uncharacterized protein YjiS (DUF1127 family)